MAYLKESLTIQDVRGHLRSILEQEEILRGRLVDLKAHQLELNAAIRQTEDALTVCGYAKRFERK